MTLGSLFDGSGGFPLAGVINGMTPVWASEIEPYPLRVTAARFPKRRDLEAFEALPPSIREYLLAYAAGMVAGAELRKKATA